MKHSNLFYIHQKDGTYQLCEKATGVRNPLGVDIFRHAGTIYDGKTGFRVCPEKDLPAYLQSRITTGEQYDALVQAVIDKDGLSPRYTQPDVRREPGPRNESRVLERAIGSKSKHYFIRTDVLENGLEIFLKEKDMAREEYSQMLYSRLDGWMAGLDTLDRKDEVLRQLLSPDLNLRQTLLERFEAMLADPKRGADLGLADLFGRRNEAEAHNQPIREAWEADRRQKAANDEAAELSRKQEQDQEYREAIADAEQKLLRGEVVRAAEINDSSLLLLLFRENNIKVPLRTQGWICSSLASIQRKGEDNATYYHRRGKDSSVIGEYIMKLIHVLEDKHKS